MVAVQMLMIQYVLGARGTSVHPRLRDGLSNFTYQIEKGDSAVNSGALSFTNVMLSWYALAAKSGRRGARANGSVEDIGYS